VSTILARFSVTRALLAAGTIVVSGCGSPPSTDSVATPPEVIVCKPVVREVTDYFEFPGQTAAVGVVDVRSRVAGYIVKVDFEDGQEVKQGDLLFEIDPRPYQAVLDRASAESTRLAALLVKAQQSMNRAERLYPSKSISEMDYEDCVAELAVAKASLQSAEAAVRDARVNLEFTRITSPISGRVSKARITEGNLAQLGSDDTTVLTTVVTTNPIYVYFNIDERSLLKYGGLGSRSGRAAHPKHLKDLKIPVEIGLPNEEGFLHRGVLDFIDNQIDSKTGTIRARGVLDNAQEYLTPGLFVRVRVPYGKPHQALLVSDRAVGIDQRQKYLLTVNSRKVVEYRPIKVGGLQDGLRVIHSGIDPQDVIIVKGLQRARAGKAVEPRDESSLAKRPSMADGGRLTQASTGRAKEE
jgi:RND family efflux transporter MFP subunit